MTMQNTRLLLILVATAVALAAVPATAQSPLPDEKPDARITDGSAQRELDIARAKWKAAHIRNYNVRVALSCFCPEEIRKPRTIKVRGTVPVKPPSHLKAVASVGRMFKRIQAAIDQGVAAIGVSYGKYGVPKTITIDVSRAIADEESYYRIDRFQKR